MAARSHKTRNSFVSASRARYTYFSTRLKRVGQFREKLGILAENQYFCQLILRIQ